MSKYSYEKYSYEMEMHELVTTSSPPPERLREFEERIREAHAGSDSGVFKDVLRERDLYVQSETTEVDLTDLKKRAMTDQAAYEQLISLGVGI